ncbi:helix-turn-helix domain-containing protein [Paenibacillus planticolens]|uniref:Helix-turn-helix domain-containing protein n=1 Tax=Paenibacillus planticolens TaxID=2654976 RepID=A0ABX1ZXK2_9BACL|nr:helix-turn-helix domain-containing protein [Paenibacillus planticolens]NOV04739.1 helix-turn-helix domain-containing protein [Paenibacillus planticolens]
MLLKKITRTNSIWTKWLISYLFIFLVPVLLGIVFYWQTLNIVEREIDLSNEKLISQMKELTDSRMRDLERLGLELSLNSEIIAFASKEYKDQGSDDYHYDARQLTLILNNFKLSNEYIDQIFLYYDKSQTVITNDSRISVGQFEKMCQPFSVDQSWTKILDSRFIKGFFLVKDTSDPNDEVQIMHIRTPYMRGLGSDGAYIMFTVKSDKLLPHAERIQLHKDSYYVIQDMDGKVIASTSKTAAYMVPHMGPLTSTNGMQDSEAEGQRLTIRYTTSNVTWWKYISVTPSSVYLESVWSVKRLIGIYMVLCLVVGALVTAFVLRRNYNPIQVLIRNLATKSGTIMDESIDEYQFIAKTLYQSLESTEKSMVQLKQQGNALRNQFLASLVKGKLEASIPLHERLTAYEIQFVEAKFAVVVVQTENWGKLVTNEPAKSYDHEKLLQFFITNVMVELAKEKNQAYMFEVDDFLVCIINGNFLTAKELTRVAQIAKKFIYDSLEVKLTVSLSDIHEDVWKLPQAYQEALEAMEYKLVMGSGEMISYTDIPSEEVSHRGYYYPLHVEQQLINFVKAGDFHQAQTVIDEILKQHLAAGSVTVILSRCLMFDIISTILKTIDELNHFQGINEMNKPLEKLMNCKTIQEMKEHVMVILQEVTNHIQGQRDLNTYHFCEKVKDYVHQNYHNPDLNISAIGQWFEMTPSYLSKRFRDETGESLLEYINLYRISQAKGLLLGESLSIADIALKVGYTEFTTFNRIFKKYQGITAGKYRETESG